MPPNLKLSFFPYLLAIAIIGFIGTVLLYNPSSWEDIPLLGHFLLLPFYLSMILGIIWFFVSIPNWFKK